MTNLENKSQTASDNCGEAIFIFRRDCEIFPVWAYDELQKVFAYPPYVCLTACAYSRTQLSQPSHVIFILAMVHWRVFSISGMVTSVAQQRASLHQHRESLNRDASFLWCMYFYITNILLSLLWISLKCESAAFNILKTN